jgi:cyclopropane fatty-acyl-phospholipid synthase-like methyltransferase
MISRERYFRFLAEARAGGDVTALSDRFERAARWYGRRLRKHLPQDRSIACLDVPCGSGNFLYFLRRRGYVNVVGYDSAPGQIERARSLGLTAIRREALEALDDATQAYGLISSLDFIEHLSRDEALTFLRLCHDRLAPGGVLVVRTPSADGPFGAHDAFNDLTHQWALTSGVLETVLEMSGFVRVSILDERPQAHSLVSGLRAAVFTPARLVASAAVVALGLTPPRVWSRSMWGVGYKAP